MINFFKCLFGKHPYVKYYTPRLYKSDIEYKFCTSCKISYDFKEVKHD